MNRYFKNILATFEEKAICVPIDLDPSQWSTVIPSGPGWYTIKSNVPKSVLERLGQPEGKRHYNIPKRIGQTEKTRPNGILILQEADERYVVYNGHAKSLKARAREHVSGHSETGCLALSQYQELKAYHWEFCYLTVASLGEEYEDNPILRKAVEQGWRAMNGWPLLCRA